MDTSVGLRMREARLSLGLSQDDVARRLGVNRASISVYERGGTIPNRSLEAFCREFRVSENFLRQGTGPMVLPPDNSLLEQVMESYQLPELFRAAVLQWSGLSQTEKEIVGGFLSRCAETARESRIETIRMTAAMTGKETQNGE